MNKVTIPVESLSSSPRAYAGSASNVGAQKTRFSDLPLPARLLLAVARVRGPSAKAEIAERYVLDTIGRIIDAGPQRRYTIEAVNLLAEVLLTPCDFDNQNEVHNPEWLSAKENLVLCVLCKVHSGQMHEAKLLARSWLQKVSVQDFSVAAAALCDSTCFKNGGAHVFTPSRSGPLLSNSGSTHRSATFTQELSLGELLLLNAYRLRIRTLPYAGINVRVVPLLSEQLAIPRIESIVDAHLMEALQYSAHIPDIRCLCCTDISGDEARLLAAMAAYYSGSQVEIKAKLSSWLPVHSVERLSARAAEFGCIVQQLGAAIPERSWDMVELDSRRGLYKECQHVKEPTVLH